MQGMNKLLQQLKLLGLFAAVLILFQLSCSEPAAASAAREVAAVTVEAVQVEVVATQCQPQRILRRMSESVKSIGEHLLLGRSTIEVSQRQEYYQKTGT